MKAETASAATEVVERAKSSLLHAIKLCEERMGVSFSFFFSHIRNLDLAIFILSLRGSGSEKKWFGFRKEVVVIGICIWSLLGANAESSTCVHKNVRKSEGLSRTHVSTVNANVRYLNVVRHTHTPFRSTFTLCTCPGVELSMVLPSSMYVTSLSPHFINESHLNNIYVIARRCIKLLSLHCTLFYTHDAHDP